MKEHRLREVQERQVGPVGLALEVRVARRRLEAQDRLELVRVAQCLPESKEKLLMMERNIFLFYCQQ